MTDVFSRAFTVERSEVKNKDSIGFCHTLLILIRPGEKLTSNSKLMQIMNQQPLQEHSPEQQQRANTSADEESTQKPTRYNMRVYHTPRRKGGSPPSSRHQSSAHYSNLFESGFQRRKEFADTGSSFY